MEKGLPAALYRIFSEISKSERKKHQEKERRDAELQKKKEFYDRISGLTNKYGVRTHTSVGTGAGRGILGYRYQTASHLVTPPVKVETPQGSVVEIQIIERLIGGSHYSINPDGFEIQGGHRTLFHIRENGDAVNWIGEEASSEERDFVSSEILDPLEKKLAELPKSERPAGKRIDMLPL